MSFLNPDFSNDLQNEQIVCIVTNTLWKHSAYNLIITKNFIFGEHLAIKAPMAYPPNYDKSKTPEELNAPLISYMTTGKVVSKQEIKGKVDIKLDNQKITKANINDQYRFAYQPNARLAAFDFDTFAFLNKYLMELKLYSGLGLTSQWGFLMGIKLENQLLKGLQNTTLSSKITKNANMK